MYNKAFRIFRNGAWGIPRLRFGGAGGKTSSNKRHSKSLTPSKRPAILPSYVNIGQYSTETVLVGYIHINLQQLWQTFERYLEQKFPDASTLATPFNDPIAESIEEYQAFLKTLGYSPIAQAAFGKKVR